jgi:hypothetical protein
MNVMWIAFGATVAAVTVVATIRRLVAVGHRGRVDTDLGTVSDGWLSENRSRKDL